MLIKYDDHSTPTNHKCIQSISSKIKLSSRILVFTGAGISVSSGIPDFRSSGGLYEIIKEKYEDECGSKRKCTLKGQDFFDASFFYNNDTKPFFYQFIGRLKELCNQAKVTPTHQFISRLQCEGKLIRWYNQNIDCIEDKLFSISEARAQSLEKLINLHGSLAFLRCTLCSLKVDFSESYQAEFTKGLIPNCSICYEKNQLRVSNGKRAIKVGQLRPDIVLYNEHHPSGDFISQVVQSDIKKNPNVIMVLGTSLKVPGFKKIVKDFIKVSRISSSTSIAIYINKTPLITSEWKDTFDYQLIGESDQWIAVLSSELSPPPSSDSPFKENLKQKDIREYFTLTKNSSLGRRLFKSKNIQT